MTRQLSGLRMKKWLKVAVDEIIILPTVLIISDINYHLSVFINKALI